MLNGDERDLIVAALRGVAQCALVALRALYEWYDRDGSVGGASEVFEAHRSALSSTECSCGADDGDPLDHHDISCPAAVPTEHRCRNCGDPHTEIKETFCGTCREMGCSVSRPERGPANG